VNIDPRSKTRLGLRISGFLLGIAALIWLPIEEQNVLGVVIISAAICIWTAIWVMAKTDNRDQRIILRHSIAGTGAGFAIAPVAIFLMALKSGIHGHGTPDFTFAQMQQMLLRTPFFALSGLLVGLGSGFWRLARRDSQSQEI
jgi:hypothetical protein